MLERTVESALDNLLSDARDPNRALIGQPNFTMNRALISGTTWDGDNAIIGDTSDTKITIARNCTGNVIVLPPATRRKLEIRVLGNDNLVYFGPSGRIVAKVSVKGTSNVFFAGAETSIGEANATLEGTAQSIIFGDDCMLAGQITLRNSDMHPIYRLDTNEHINAPKSIILHPHVWVGQRSQILKGVSIGAGSIVSAGALVTRSLAAFRVSGGVPAKELKDEPVTWLRGPKDAAAQIAKLKMQLGAVE